MSYTPYYIVPSAGSPQNKDLIRYFTLLDTAMADSTTGLVTIAGVQTITGAKTFSGQLIGKGTATNDAAAAGYIGEIVTGSRLRASSVSLSNATAANVLAASISLTAGSWIVSFVGGFTGSATATHLVVALSATTATLPANSTNAAPNSTGELTVINTLSAALATDDHTLSSPTYSVHLSGSQSLFMVALANFPSGTVSVYGSVLALRVR